MFTVWITWRVNTVQIHMGPATMLTRELAPSYRLPSLDGSTVWGVEMRGEGKLVLGFWGGWSGPCGKKLPAFGMIYPTNHKSPTSYGLVTVSIAERSDVQAAVQRKLPFEVLLDTAGAHLRAFGAGGIPVLLMIDQTETVTRDHVG
jgi:hypothetical protein